MKPRLFFYALFLAAVFLIARASAAPADDPPAPTPDPAPVNVKVQGKTAAQWHMVAARYRRKLLIRWKPTVQYAYRLASAIYGIPYGQLHSVGGCESTHYPYARNGIHRGIMQEGPMFESSALGHAGFSVWDPIANVLVAASVVRSDGGWGQWSCKPGRS